MVTKTKYDLRTTEDIKGFIFKPVGTSMKNFQRAVESHNCHELNFVHYSGDKVGSTAIYHQISGATVLMDLYNEGGIIITGTEKSIKDAQSSLELLTQWRLKEVK